jgi:PKD repeat protein
MEKKGTSVLIKNLPGKVSDDMRITISLLAWVLPFTLMAQLQLRYQRCTNCTFTNSPPTNIPNGGFTYSSTIETMGSQQVQSDYGRRSSNSRWHMGIDYSAASGDEDAGDAILPIETGTIVRLKGTGYKSITVRGGHRFGYGHLFFDGIPGAGGMRSGNFILKEMNPPHTGFYAIIYISPSGTVAYGEVNGTVSHLQANGGQPINVTTQVTNVNNPLAPIGDSGDDDVTDDDFAAHVHLYSFQNDPVGADFNSNYPAGYQATRFRNTKNPMEFLQHDQAAYLMTFPNINMVYPGTSRSSFRVRAAMSGQTGTGNYSVSMDIDAVELFLKRKYEPFSNFRYYKGSVLESKMSYGGRVNTNRYPSIDFPTHNTGANAIDIAKGVENNVDLIGTLDRTGIHAFAYSSNGGQPYDEFYFSDFFSRIHKDDNYGGNNARFAGVNSDARYTDGEYDYYVRLTTADNQSHNSNFETLILDNFRPYVKEVVIRKENESGAMIYRGFWDWNGTQLNLFKEDYNAAGPSDNVWIKITMSESMKFSVGNPVSINISSADGSTFRPMTPIADAEEREFVITYSPFALAGINLMSIRGYDHNDNLIERMATSPANVPIRLANNTWTVTPNPGTDQNHSFNSGEGSCGGSPGGRVATGNCLIADFNSNVRTANPGSPIVFTNLSSGQGTLQYAWSFGAGASPATASTPGPHSVTYSSTGNKTVSLMVTDISGQVTTTKSNYISVSQNSSSADFTASVVSGTQPLVVNFSPVFSGTVNTYNWTFPGGSPSTSTDANPTVTYSNSGSYNVSLTINGLVTIDKPGLINIGASPSLSASVSYCNNYYFTNCDNNFEQYEGIYFRAAVTGGTPFYNYSWNFGDGNTSNAIEPLHSYSSGGIYTVTLTITDSRGVSASSVTSVNIASVIPSINVSWQTSHTYVGAGSGPVIFTDATTSNVNLNYAEYFWDFGVGAYPRYAYTKGPHEVCYNGLEPSKNVYLRVHDPITYTTDDLAAQNHIYVAASNVSQCSSTTPRWEPTRGAASGGAVQNCLYPGEIVGINNGRLTSITCDTNGGARVNCAFNPLAPCFNDIWYASHGDPSLVSEHNNALRLWTRSWNDPPNNRSGIASEGIFYQHHQNFLFGKRYILTFYAKVSDYDMVNNGGWGIIDHLKVSLTNGLAPYLDCDGNGPPQITYELPDYQFSLHELGSFEYAVNTSAWKCYEVYFYPPNNNFNQIWIYPYDDPSGLSPSVPQAQDAWMYIDDFSLRVDTETYPCPPDVIASSTNPANHIGAAFTISTSNVITILPGENKSYRAGRQIKLLPGFSALEGSAFSATIGSCISSAGKSGSDPAREFDNYLLPYSMSSPNGEEQVEPGAVEELQGESIEVYPNPASSELTVKFNRPSPSEARRITIINILGITVNSGDCSGLSEKTFNVSELSSGVYLLRIETSGRIMYKEFIKQ